MKRFACLRIYKDAATYINRAVAEVDDDGYVIRCYPFDQEQASTEWIGGVILLMPCLSIERQEWANKSLDEVLPHVYTPSDKLSAWHIDSIDWENMKIRTSAHIARLK